ncbi:ClpXP adapter SpxH family protein [Flavobacterium sp.]|uniref:ClpXP adapter SpxH family protein n=1 Tax=Flavobacterium sp. TaxID=239 RepID=UPI0039E46AC1
MIRLFIQTVVLLFTYGCTAQNHQKMKNNHPNPLLCNPEAGFCEIPSSGNPETQIAAVEQQKPIRIVYFTDPICSSCWGIEPQLRRLKLAYGDHFEIDYRMGGLLPSWDGFNGGGITQPLDVAQHWDEVSRYYDMPIDGSVWLEDPLHSSYPPSIAFKAAQFQDPRKAVAFLRRIREMVFVEKKNITRWEYLEQAAMESGLDVKQLKTDFEGKAKKAFEEDLDLARKMGVRGFPTLFFSNAQQQVVLYGSKPYAHFEQAIQQLEAGAVRKEVPADFHTLFGHYPTLTTKEYATLAGIGMAEAEKLLEHHSMLKRLTKKVTKNGVLWQY